MCYYLKNMFFLISIICASSKLGISDTSFETIRLTKNNTVVLRGEITQSSADTFFKHVYTRENPIVFIHSPGGSVMAGQRIMEYMRVNNVTCITDQAYSMAFVTVISIQSKIIFI